MKKSILNFKKFYNMVFFFLCCQCFFMEANFLTFWASFETSSRRGLCCKKIYTNVFYESTQSPLSMTCREVQNIASTLFMAIFSILRSEIIIKGQKIINAEQKSLRNIPFLNKKAKTKCNHLCGSVFENHLRDVTRPQITCSTLV